MSLLFETIRMEDGVPGQIAWHEQRMNHARREVWGIEQPVLLKEVLSVPDAFLSGLVRCNIYYGPDIQNITFKPIEKRSIRSLKLVVCDDLDYHLKFTGRQMLETLLALREKCDEIIIVKNGLLTDTSMSNIIFYNGADWVTPAIPLLKGTCRERLIHEGKLVKSDIRPEDLQKFTGCKLINALRLPEEEIMIPVSQIIY